MPDGKHGLGPEPIDREARYMAAPTVLLGLPPGERIREMVFAARTAGLDDVANTLAGMYELLLDKQYIRVRADYNRGHLSYYGQLGDRERRAMASK